MCYFDTFISCDILWWVPVCSDINRIASLQYNIVTYVIILCIRSLRLIYCLLQVCILEHHQFYPPSPHFSLFFTSLTFLVTTYKWYHSALVFLCWLISISAMCSRSLFSDSISLFPSSTPTQLFLPFGGRSDLCILLSVSAC